MLKVDTIHHCLSSQFVSIRAITRSLHGTHCRLVPLQLVDRCQGNEIDEFADSENRRSQQQSQKSSNFTE